jgi:hypothetical protein
VAQMPDSGFTVQPFRGSSGSPLPPGFMGTVVLLLLATSWVQAQSTPTSNSIGKNKPTISAVSPVPPQEVAPPPVVPPPAPPTVEQKPPQPPAVAWDGQQLTIDAENSTLAAVLGAVRDRTGASIEIPGAASGERVFVHLGPGPARDIISSLLYGTQFDYIIEAADDDPDTLRSVVLTPRGLGDSSSDVVAGATNTGEGSGSGGSTPAAVAHRGEATDGRARPEGVRMMPGWAGPSKPAFQADAEAALAAEAAAQDTAAAQGAAAAQDAVASKEDSAAAADAAEGKRASNSSHSTSDSDDPSGAGQAIQSMTRMFERRRQIQAQQNQPPPPSSN